MNAIGKLLTNSFIWNPWSNTFEMITFSPFYGLIPIWPNITCTNGLLFTPFKLHWNQDAEIFLMVQRFGDLKTLQFSLKLSTGSGLPTEVLLDLQKWHLLWHKVRTWPPHLSCIICTYEYLTHKHNEDCNNIFDHKYYSITSISIYISCCSH